VSGFCNCTHQRDEKRKFSMTASVMIPDDLHQQLRERAEKNHATVDEFAVYLMRGAIGVQLQDHPIRQEGRFACFDLPKDAPPLDLDRIQAALYD
jgi:hypothetical protein